MIKYVNPENIDNRIFNHAKEILNNGGIIAMPTDTNFSIFSEISSKEGIKKLKKLKGNSSFFTFTLFSKDISTISNYAYISNRNFKYLKHYTPGPYVFILECLKETEKIIDMKRKEIGVRIPSNKILQEFLIFFEKPLFGITASKNMINDNWFTKEFAEENLFQFGWELEEIKDIDLIIDDISGESHPKILSTVVDLSKEEITVIREGIGDFKIL